MQLLSGALENLENLKSLNISCNYITSNGLRELSAKVGNEISLPVSKKCCLTSHCDLNVLQSLCHLNLSHNSLGAEGLQVMSELLDNLSLTSLNLSNCELLFPETGSDLASTLNRKYFVYYGMLG